LFQKMASHEDLVHKVASRQDHLFKGEVSHRTHLFNEVDSHNEHLSKEAALDMISKQSLFVPSIKVCYFSLL
jgi:hypothetical protein